MTELAEKVITALARHEMAAQGVTRVHKQMVAAMHECPEHIKAMESHWDGGAETPFIDKRGRPKTHLWSALNSTTDCDSGYGSRQLNDDDIEEFLADYDGNDEACEHCLKAWRLFLERRKLRIELGKAKSHIRILGKQALKVAQ